MYSEKTIKEAEQLHEQSDSWLTCERVMGSYQSHGHSEESFLKNMHERALYRDFCDLDDISICGHDAAGNKID